jgi:tetraacyldisaccharide 4'-kinase
LPVLAARLAPLDPREFRDARVFAFAGIGRPEKFVETLRSCGAEVTDAQFFPDHHPYTAAEIAALKSRAGDGALITTEKDFVRLAPAQAEGIAVLKVRACFQRPELLDSLLAAV